MAVQQRDAKSARSGSSIFGGLTVIGSIALVVHFLRSLCVINARPWGVMNRVSPVAWVGLILMLGGGLACAIFPSQILRWSARHGDRNAGYRGAAGVMRGYGRLLIVLGSGALYLISS